MNKWFTVSVRYTKQLDNGTFQRVTEQHLIAAMTHGDAEERTYTELASQIKGEFNIVRVIPANYHDIFAYDDADVWYKVKICYLTCSDESEKGKKVTQHFLVAAHSVSNAESRIKEALSNLMVDFQVPSISISPIVEIFPYTEIPAEKLMDEPKEYTFLD